MQLLLLIDSSHHLPPIATIAEFLVDLPLAYFVPPISTTPGQLPLILDLEDKR